MPNPTKQLPSEIITCSSITDATFVSASPLFNEVLACSPFLPTEPKQLPPTTSPSITHLRSFNGRDININNTKTNSNTTVKKPSASASSLHKKVSSRSKTPSPSTIISLQQRVADLLHHNYELASLLATERFKLSRLQAEQTSKSDNQPPSSDVAKTEKKEKNGEEEERLEKVVERLDAENSAIYSCLEKERAGKNKAEHEVAELKLLLGQRNTAVVNMSTALEELSISTVQVVKQLQIATGKVAELEETIRTLKTNEGLLEAAIRIWMEENDEWKAAATEGWLRYRELEEELRHFEDNAYTVQVLQQRVDNAESMLEEKEEELSHALDRAVAAEAQVGTLFDDWKASMEVRLYEQNLATNVHADKVSVEPAPKLPPPKVRLTRKRKADLNLPDSVLIAIHSRSSEAKGVTMATSLCSNNRENDSKNSLEDVKAALKYIKTESAATPIIRSSRRCQRRK